MRLKKLSLLVSLVVSALFLTSCGTDHKAAFIKSNEALAKLPTQAFDFKTDELKLVADGAASTYVPIINGYLASTKLSGKIVTDGKKTQANLEVSLSDQKIPLELVTQDTDVLLKLDTLQPILAMYMQTLSADVDMGNFDMTVLKGKYLNVKAVSEETSQEAALASSLSPEDAKKATDKALASLEKSDFTKAGTAVTLTLSGEKMIKFIKTYLSALPKDNRKAYETLLKDQSIEKQLPKIIKSMVITTDSQKKTAKVSLNFTGRKSKDIGLSGKIVVNLTYSDAKTTVKLPEKSNIIKTSEEFNRLISEMIQIQVPESF